jgi:hypothetical protein
MIRERVPFKVRRIPSPFCAPACIFTCTPARLRSRPLCCSLLAARCLLLPPSPPAAPHTRLAHRLASAIMMLPSAGARSPLLALVASASFVIIFIVGLMFFQVPTPSMALPHISRPGSGSTHVEM